MAEASLLRGILTNEMIDSGAELTRKLAESDFGLTASLWLFDSEISEWLLVFASSRVRNEGPIAAYNRINRVMESLPRSLKDHLPLLNIRVLEPDEGIMSGLKKVVKSGNEISPIRLRHRPVDGGFIDDALVYCAA